MPDRSRSTPSGKVTHAPLAFVWTRRALEVVSEREWVTEAITCWTGSYCLRLRQWLPARLRREESTPASDLCLVASVGVHAVELEVASALADEENLPTVG